MSGLKEVYGEGGRRRAVGRAVVLLVASLVACVGFVATIASLIAGFGVDKAVALKVSAAIGTGLLFAGFFGLAVLTTAKRSGTLAAVGAVFAVAGFARFWTGLPAGWTGRFGDLPPFAVGAYAAGLLAVFVAGLLGEPGDGRSAAAASGSVARSADAESLGSVESVLPADADDRTAGPGSSTVSDGGEVEGDLRFFDSDE